MNYDIRSELSSFIDETELTDPTAISAAFVTKVPAKELRSALEWALREKVRQTLSQRRAANPILTKDPVVINSDGSVRTRRPASQLNSSASVKAASIRERHQKWLRDLVHVDGVNQYKPLGECTYADLMFAAESRRQSAADNLAKAERFEEIAKLVKRKRVKTVADLSENDLLTFVEAEEKAS